MFGLQLLGLFLVVLLQGCHPPGMIEFQPVDLLLGLILDRVQRRYIPVAVIYPAQQLLAKQFPVIAVAVLFGHIAQAVEYIHQRRRHIRAGNIRVKEVRVHTCPFLPLGIQRYRVGVRNDHAAHASFPELVVATVLVSHFLFLLLVQINPAVPDLLQNILCITAALLPGAHMALQPLHGRLCRLFHAVPCQFLSSGNVLIHSVQQPRQLFHVTLGIGILHKLPGRRFHGRFGKLRAAGQLLLQFQQLLQIRHIMLQLGVLLLQHPVHLLQFRVTLGEPNIIVPFIESLAQRNHIAGIIIGHRLGGFDLLRREHNSFISTHRLENAVISSSLQSSGEINFLNCSSRNGVYAHHILQVCADLVDRFIRILLCGEELRHAVLSPLEGLAVLVGEALLLRVCQKFPGRIAVAQRHFLDGELFLFLNSIHPGRELLPADSRAFLRIIGVCPHTLPLGNVRELLRDVVHPCKSCVLSSTLVGTLELVELAVVVWIAHSQVRWNHPASVGCSLVMAEGEVETFAKPSEVAAGAAKQLAVEGGEFSGIGSVVENSDPAVLVEYLVCLFVIAVCAPAFRRCIHHALRSLHVTTIDSIHIVAVPVREFHILHSVDQLQPLSVIALFIELNGNTILLQAVNNTLACPIRQDRRFHLVEPHGSLRLCLENIHRHLRHIIQQLLHFQGSIIADFLAVLLENSLDIRNIVLAALADFRQNLTDAVKPEERIAISLLTIFPIDSFNDGIHPASQNIADFFQLLLCQVL